MTNKIICIEMSLNMNKFTQQMTWINRCDVHALGNTPKAPCAVHFGVCSAFWIHSTYLPKNQSENKKLSNKCMNLNQIILIFLLCWFFYITEDNDRDKETVTQPEEPKRSIASMLDRVEGCSVSLCLFFVNVVWHQEDHFLQLFSRTVSSWQWQQ